MQVTTTASQILSTGFERETFVIEADDTNTDKVRISSVDPSVTKSWVSLSAGQQVTFYRWRGTIWAIAKAGTQNVYAELFGGGEDSNAFKTS